MQVGATGQMQQMQMRKMDGSGRGQGQGMGAVMQSLPTDDRKDIRDQLQSMSEEDRMSAVQQIKQLDVTSMSSDDLLSSINDILNPTDKTQNSSDSGLDLYA